MSTAIAAVRSVAAYVAVSLYVALAAPIGMAIAILFRWKNILYVLGHWGVTLGTSLAGIRTHVAGRENVPAHAVVFCANHQSNIDPPILIGPDGGPELDPKAVLVSLSTAANPDPSVPADITAGLAKSEVLITYAIIPDWLHDPSREFPVTLDPSVCISDQVAGCANGAKDEFIYSFSPNSHASGWTVLRVGYDARTEPVSPQAYDAMRPLIYMPDVALPDGAQITAATTTVRVSNVYGSPGSKYLRFYRVNVGWGTNSVTWNNIVPGGFDSTSGSPVFQIPAGIAAGNTMTIDMVDIARQWYTRRAQDWKSNTGTIPLRSRAVVVLAAS